MIVAFWCWRRMQSPNDVIQKIDSHTSTQKLANNDFGNTKNTS